MSSRRIDTPEYPGLVKIDFGDSGYCFTITHIDDDFRDIHGTEILVYGCDCTSGMSDEIGEKVHAALGRYLADRSDRLPVGTVLKAKDPEPPDGTLLMLANGTWESYDSRLTTVQFDDWSFFALRFGPFVVGPNYRALVSDANTELSR